jgi:hypothetical protein
MQQKTSPTTINKTSSPLNKSNDISSNAIIKPDPYDRSTPINKSDDQQNHQHHQQQIVDPITSSDANITYNPVSSPFSNFTNSANSYYDYGFTTANALANTYNPNTLEFYHNSHKTSQLNQATSNLWQPTEFFQPSSNYSNFLTMSGGDNASKYYSNYANYGNYQRPTSSNIFSSTTNSTSQFDNFPNFLIKTNNSPNEMIKLEQAHLADQQPSLLASRLQTPALNSEITNSANLLYNQFNQPHQQLQHQRISPASSNSLSSSTTSPLYMHNDINSKYHFSHYNTSPTSSLNLLATTCSSSNSSNTNRSCTDTNSDQLNDTQTNITPINSSSGSSSSPSASDTNNNNNNNNINHETGLKNQPQGITYDWLKPVKNPSNGKSIIIIS